MILRFTKYRVSCYLWRIGRVLKPVKFQNIMTKIVWKLFVLLPTLQMIIEVSGNVYLPQKSSIKKLPMSKIENFPKSNFDLNLIWKIVLTQNQYIWNFNAIELLYIFKDWNYRKCQKIEVMTNNQAISDKIFLSRVKKSFKIGQG